MIRHNRAQSFLNLARIRPNPAMGYSGMNTRITNARNIWSAVLPVDRAVEAINHNRALVKILLAAPRQRSDVIPAQSPSGDVTVMNPLGWFRRGRT